jgi:hypothetical protein
MVVFDGGAAGLLQEPLPCRRARRQGWPHHLESNDPVQAL